MTDQENVKSTAAVLRGAYAGIVLAHKYQRQIFRTEAAYDASRKTFSQIREEQWVQRIASGEKRYACLDLGTRKSGMLCVSAGGRLNPKHGRKAKRGQPLGGRGSRAYRAR